VSLTVYALVSVLAVWMLAVGYCGYARRFVLCLGVLAIGVALNATWMVFGLGAHPVEPHALMAQASLLLYGFCALGAGWLVGRIARLFRDSRVDDADGTA
jgi:hypothetical protein